MSYVVDIVLCADATASMTPFIDKLKIVAVDLYSDLTDRYAKLEKSVKTLRVRVIAYRDYDSDPVDALQMSSVLPASRRADRF